MKKIYAIALAALLGTQAKAQTPVIVNAGFEAGFRAVVVTNTFPPVNLLSEAPEGWFCADSMVAGLALDPIIGLMLADANFNQQCFADTNSYSGDFAVGIKSSHLLDTFELPGILSNAKMTFDVAAFVQTGDLDAAVSYSGGTPTLGQKVDEVTAKVFLDTVFRKDALMLVTAYAVDPDNGEYTVIGSGSAHIGPAEIYQDVTVTVDYLRTDFTATDTMVITFFSSNDYEVTTDSLNYLVVDDVEASYSEGALPEPSSIKTLYTQNEVILYPVPANDVLNVDFKAYQPSHTYTINVLSADGRLVQSSTLKDRNMALDISALQSGLYLVELIENNRSVFVQKISK